MGKVVEFLPEEHPTRANFNKKFREITDQLTPSGVGALPDGKTVETHPFPFVSEFNVVDGLCAFWKNSFGEVHVMLSQFGKTDDGEMPTSFSTIGTLPNGYRPSRTIYTSGSSGSNSFGILAVQPNGNVLFKSETPNKKYGIGINLTFPASK